MDIQVTGCSDLTDALIPWTDSDLCLCMCRYEQLLALVHSVNGASLLVGGPGTAKTTVINQFLGKFNSEVSAA